MTRPSKAEHETDEPLSKSAKKRESEAFQDMARQLVALSPAQLTSLPDDLQQNIRTAQTITRGNARKRQIQYIGKMLRKDQGGIVEQVTTLLAQLDASSTSHNQRFHQLEQWRDRLIQGDDTVFDEIRLVCPDIDRQQLRQLTQRARSEADSEQPHGTYYRSLFQFIKNATQDPG